MDSPTDAEVVKTRIERGEVKVNEKGRRKGKAETKPSETKPRQKSLEDETF